ncbi:hypothetical protein F7725_022197 [Dissostichus mawsoni]|uniref:Rab-GAP TBC domain-containing protein n=1 Tax=Dissostichus mawsoni TaxID=36200 RepID=A0A7J5YX21_DISMA|nr:hypothetical protein F7725_022197 [Dissostichus mawsoni]
MASRLRAYKAVIKNYNSVILHMEEASNRKTEEGAKCVGYLKVLKSAKFVDGLHFMVDVLEVLANVSLAFQSNDLFIYDVDVELCEARINLEGLKHNRGDVYTAYMATCKDGKFDSKNNGHITSLKGTGIPETLKNSFLENSVKFLEKRFSFLKDTPFSDFPVLDPRNVPRSDAQLATYGDVQVMNMVTHFESVLSEEEVTNIPRQWPAFKARLKYRQRQPPKEVISDLLTENHPDVKDVLVYIMVTLSPSSAAVERRFSLMILIKTSRKSRMTNETLGSLMRVSHITTTVAEFDQEPAIQKWKTSAKTKRYVKAARKPAAVNSNLPVPAAPQPARETAAESVGVLSVHFVMPWFLTLFTSLPCWDSVLAVWDLIILHGLSAVFRTALTIMELLEPRLMELNDEGAVLPLLLRVPVDVAQYSVLVPALWNTEVQDWELKCINSLVLDESHHGPNAEQSQPQKATPPTPVNGGKEKENVSPPSEGKKTSDSITGAKTLLSRMMRVAQRYLLDPMGRQKAEEKTSQTQAKPRQRASTLGRVFKGRISASLTQAQMRAKRQSQHRGRSQQAGVQGGSDDVTVAPVTVTDTAGNTDSFMQLYGKSPSDHTTFGPWSPLRQTHPSSCSSTLPPSSPGPPSSNGAQSGDQQKDTPRTALIK